MAQLYDYLVSGRYLKPVQIWGRLRTLAQSRALHPFSIYRTRYRSKASGQEPFEPLQFSDIEWSVRNSVNSHNLDEIESHIFTFLNRRVHLGDPIDWTRDGETKLWQYNLHYFDYSIALGWQYANHQREKAYQLFRRLAQQWIESCPVATSIAWDSYPLSLRISNWIKSYTLFLPALLAKEIFCEQLALRNPANIDRRASRCFGFASCGRGNISCFRNGQFSLVQLSIRCLFQALFLFGRAPLDVLYVWIVSGHRLESDNRVTPDSYSYHITIYGVSGGQLYARNLSGAYDMAWSKLYICLIIHPDITITRQILLFPS